MHTASLHAHAGSHRVDAVVIALHGYLGTFSRHACNLAYRDQAVMYFRHLGFQQTLQKDGRGTAQDNLGIVVRIVHLTLAVKVGRYLFRLGQYQFVALVVYAKHLFFPYLIYLRAHDLAHTVLILII